jgi:hypothetical protein
MIVFGCRPAYACEQDSHVWLCINHIELQIWVMKVLPCTHGLVAAEGALNVAALVVSRALCGAVGGKLCVAFMAACVCVLVWLLRAPSAVLRVPMCRWRRSALFSCMFADGASADGQAAPAKAREAEARTAVEKHTCHPHVVHVLVVWPSFREA